MDIAVSHWSVPSIRDGRRSRRFWLPQGRHNRRRQLLPVLRKSNFSVLSGTTSRATTIRTRQQPSASVFVHMPIMYLYLNFPLKCFLLDEPCGRLCSTLYVQRCSDVICKILQIMSIGTHRNQVESQVIRLGREFHPQDIHSGSMWTVLLGSPAHTVWLRT